MQNFSPLASNMGEETEVTDARIYGSFCILQNTIPCMNKVMLYSIEKGIIYSDATRPTSSQSSIIATRLVWIILTSQVACWPAIKHK